jgi:hypothetical protein
MRCLEILIVAGFTILTDAVFGKINPTVPVSYESIKRELKRRSIEER